MKQRALDDKILKFFNSYKNPKLGIFYISLINNFGYRNISLGKIKLAYEFNVCERTIRNWLKELKKIGFVDFNTNQKHFAWIRVKRYCKSENFKNFILGKKNLPNRFFKEVALIIKSIKKHYDGYTAKDKSNILFNLKLPTKNKMSFFKRVLIEFSPKQDPNETLSLTYEQLTKQNLPSIECTYHLAIIKKRITSRIYDYLNLNKDLE